MSSIRVCQSPTFLAFVLSLTTACASNGVDVGVDAGDGGGDAFSLASDDAVTVTLGIEGGELVLSTANGPITVTVPPLALLEETEITVTPLANYALPGFVAGVNFAPQGLAFHAPLAVRMPSGDYAFGYSGEGDRTHLHPFAVDGDELVVEIWHFSGVGVGAGAVPDTTPLGDDAATLDAIARGNATTLRASLTSEWEIVDGLLTNAAVNRPSYDNGQKTFNSWHAKVQLAGLLATFDDEVQSGQTRLRGALIAERDRLVTFAIETGDWTVLRDLTTWVLPRSQVRGLHLSGPLSIEGMRATVPMTVALADVALVYNSTDERYHLVGTSSVSFNGGPAITNPGMHVDATVFGSVEVTFTGETAAGAFDLPVTQNRETLSANVVVRFLGLDLDITTSTTAGPVANTAPLRVTVRAEPASFLTTAGSTIRATLMRGAGPLGLVGEVTFSNSNANCSLAASSGTPDENGEVTASVTCTYNAVTDVAADGAHNSDNASQASTQITATLDCSNPPAQPAVSCLSGEPDLACACMRSACEAIGQCLGCGSPEGVEVCQCLMFC